MTTTEVRTYSSSEVCERAGITYRQLEYFVRRAVVDWPFRRHPGSGYARRWTEVQMYVICVLGALNGLHATADVLRRVAQEISAMDLSAQWLVVGSDNIAAISDVGDLVSALLETRPGAYVLDLPAVLRGP